MAKLDKMEMINFLALLAEAKLLAIPLRIIH